MSRKEEKLVFTPVPGRYREYMEQITTQTLQALEAERRLLRRLDES